MNLFKKKKKNDELTVQTAVSDGYEWGSYSLWGTKETALCERRLYRLLRRNVPIIDAAICKLIRLLGSFNVRCEDRQTEDEINSFLRNVRVDGTRRGIDSFLSSTLDQLLTYGTSVGEIVLDGSGKKIAALYNASLNDVELCAGKNPLDVQIFTIDGNGEKKPVDYPSLILCSTLMNEPGCVYGTSLLRGLPFVGELLVKIFHALGTNWDRVGNVRFAVSYKPGENDRSFTKDRAAQIASEWSKAMKSPEPKDFVSVGDVSIKVIGAENQIPDSQVPVRLILEQILSKFSIPPFLMGLSWSSTERMSAQQADILTSEMEFYRRTLEESIRGICDMWMKLNGLKTDYSIEWDNINLQDEVELARARLLNAQAQALESKEGE